MSLPDFKGWRAYLGMLLLGAMSSLGFAPLGYWPLTLLALALLMAAVEASANKRQAFGRGWLFGLGHFTIGLNWIAGAFQFQDAMPVWFGWGAVVGLSLYLALFPAVVAGIAWRFGKGRPLSFLFLFAASWLVAEYMRASLFTGFAWNPIGVIAVDRASVAALIGTYGLGAIVILAAGAMWLALRRDGRGAVIAAFLPLLALAYGLEGRVSPRPVAASVQPLIHIVQPNIGQQDKWRDDYAAQNFARLARLSGHAGAAPRLIFWPEAAIPDYLEDEPWARARIASLIGPRDVLLTGGVSIVWGKDDQAKAAHNSLFAVDGQGRLRGRYDKAHLVPFGEYLPMRPWLSAIGLSRLVPGDLDFWPGPGAQTIDLPGFGRMGAQVCYEIIFSGHVVDRAHRPDFLFNPSNDAWFGSWGPPQHLAQARLRAVEEAMPILRSTPTGISAVVDAEGRIVAALPFRKAGFITTHLPAPRAPTLFAQFGNRLSFGLAMILLLAAIALRKRTR